VVIRKSKSIENCEGNWAIDRDWSKEIWSEDGRVAWAKDVPRKLGWLVSLL
jgi:hypothetical protein